MKCTEQTSAGQASVLSVGQRVRAHDRGNFGEIIECRGGDRLVRFVNPSDGSTRERWFASSQLSPLGADGKSNGRANNGRPRVSPEVLDHAPPHDLQAEQALLGAIIVDPSQIDCVTAVLRPDQLYDKRHRLILDHLCHCTPEQLGDPCLLANRLLGVGDLEACGGVDYIASLPGKVGAPSHATHYAGIVTDNYRRRMIRELGIQAVQWSVSSTDPIDASIQHLSEALRAASDDATGGKFTGTTLAELDQVVFDDEFLIDGILTAEQPGICGALPKQFKTTQMVDMAISLATATPWLGHFPVRRPVRVAYMSGEGGRKFVQAVARRVCRSKGVPMPEDVIFEDRLPKMARPEDLIDLRRFLRREAVEVLFCDPVYLCMDGGEASNVMKQGEQLAPFNEVCQDCGVTPILVHHLRKSSESRFTLEPPELSDLAQAGFAEFAGQWWLLGREQRYDPAQPGSHRLWLSWGSRMGFGGKKGLAIEVGTYPESYWDVTVHDPSEIQEQRADATDQKRAERVRLKDEKDMQTVCNILAEFTDGETKAVIRNRGHFSGARVADLLDILVTEGHVEAFDGEKANQPCKLYRLPE